MIKTITPKIRIRPRLSEGEASEQRIVGEPASPMGKQREPNRGSWAKGFCPNPTGRPKGAKGLKAVTRKILSEKITLRDAKGPKRIALFEGLLRKEVELASKGDWRARKTVLELGRWALPDPIEPSAEAAAAQSVETLSATQQAMLDLLTDEIREDALASLVDRTKKEDEE